MSHTYFFTIALLAVFLFILVGLFGDSSRGGRRFFHVLAAVLVIPLLLLYIRKLLRRQNS